MVDVLDEMEAVVVDCSGFECGHNEASVKIEENMIKRANILGISMEGELGDVRSFIQEMLDKEKVEVN